MSIQPRIYVADLAAYNNGILHGQWIDAAQDVDGIRAQIQTMLEASPVAGAEEYAIHDYEGFGDFNLSGYEGLGHVVELAAFIEAHGALGAKLYQHYSDLDETRKALDECYAGEYGSLADFAQHLTEETSEIPEHLAFYIDYGRMGRDWELSGDIFTIQTAHDAVHVFWSH